MKSTILGGKKQFQVERQSEREREKHRADNIVLVYLIHRKKEIYEYKERDRYLGKQNEIEREKEKHRAENIVNF